MALNGLTNRLLSGLTEIWSPQPCFVCGCGLVEGEKQICAACLRKLPATGFQRYNANPVERRFWGRAKIEGGFAGFYYRKEQVLQRLIHSFKYHGNTEMAFVLGNVLGQMMLDNSDKFLAYDFLVPVPLHPYKLKLRGYNQSRLIADGISEVVGMPVNEEILIRNQFSGTQTKRHKYERWEGVENNFGLGTDGERWTGARLLIVDDVLTTGATIESCYQALSAIPMVKIGVVTVGVAAS